VKVEDRLPGEMLDPRDADGVLERVALLGRRANDLHQLLARSRHRLEASSGRDIGGERVRQRRDDVEVLRMWKQVQEDEDERRMSPEAGVREEHELADPHPREEQREERTRRR